MGEFFKGWRRKVGCTALLLALVLTAIWIRGFVVADTLRIRSGATVTHIVSSKYGISGDRFSATNPDELTKVLRFHYYRRWYSTLADRVNSPLDLMSKNELVWHYQYLGFQVGEGVPQPPFVRQLFVIIPYWALISPFMLLSAFLLLWPVKRKPKSPVRII